MNLIEVYENLKSRSVADVLQMASANNTVYKEAQPLLEPRNPTEDVPIEDFVRLFAPMDLKTGIMINIFDDLSNDDDNIDSSILIECIGNDANLLFQPGEKIDLIGFLGLSDIFDDEGQVAGIPESMLSQLRKVNQRLNDLNEDISFSQRQSEDMSNQLHAMKSVHQAEKNELFEAAAAVEMERDALYSELKEVRKQLHQRSKVQNNDNADVPLSVELVAATESQNFNGFDDVDNHKEQTVVYNEIGATAILAENPTPKPTVNAEVVIDANVQCSTDTDNLDAECAADNSILETKAETTQNLESTIITDVQYSTVTSDSIDATSTADTLETKTAAETTFNSDFDIITDVKYSEIKSNKPAVDVWSAAAYNTEPWYFENLSRTDAEALLRTKHVGFFIVRKSSRHPGWALSICGFKHESIHYLIMEVEGGVALQFVDQDVLVTVAPVCKNLVDLITHFSKTNINTDTPVLQFKN